MKFQSRSKYFHRIENVSKLWARHQCVKCTVWRCAYDSILMRNFRKPSILWFISDACGGIIGRARWGLLRGAHWSKCSPPEILRNTTQHYCIFPATNISIKSYNLKRSCQGTHVIYISRDKDDLWVQNWRWFVEFWVDVSPLFWWLPCRNHSVLVDLWCWGYDLRDSLAKISKKKVQ